MVSRVLAGSLVAIFTFLVFFARWALGRVGTLVDGMIEHDYPSLATRLGDLFIWLAAQRTPDPDDRFEEWISHIQQQRSETGKPCLPEAIYLFITAGLVAPLMPEDHAYRPRTSDLDPSLVSSVMDEIFRLWVDPELVLRGGTLDRAAIYSAQVVMSPGKPPVVRLNEEAKWQARLPAKRAISSGEEVTTDDVDLEGMSDIRPFQADANAGWTGFFTVANKRGVAFDFRRNRDRARTLIGKARTHLENSRQAVESGRWRIAVAELLGAADITVLAQIYLHDDHPPDNPADRRRNFREFARLGNAPDRFPRSLDRLADLSVSAARRFPRLRVRRKELKKLENIVAQMIDFADHRIGPWPSAS